MKNFYTLFIIILIILISISTGYYFTIFKPEQPPKIENEIAEDDPLKMLNQHLIDLKLKKNFWKNKIKLAEQEQYNIFIDLSDSTFTLEISGIIAHSTTILNFELAENLVRLKQSEKIIQALRDPFHLLEEWSSIPKKPIRVKDISGFEWNPDSLNFVPTEVDTGYVFVVLKCSGDLTMMISQRAKIGEMPSYITSDHLSKFRDLVNRVHESDEISFSGLIQKNWVGIEIPRSDAIAIYRAINENSLLILCL